MDPRLTAPLQPVLADLRSTGHPCPRIEDQPWSLDDDRPSAMMYGARGGRGLAVSASATRAEQVSEAADHLQEWVVEECWQAGLPTNWPACPSHPDTHPLTPAVRAGSAVWLCPTDDHPVVAIGQLPRRPGS